MPGQSCNKCGMYKNLSCFHRQGKGFRKTCKECRKEERKIRYTRYKENVEVLKGAINYVKEKC